MVRVKRGNVARKRRNKILSLASGYRGAHSVLFRVANQQVMKASRLNGLTYSGLIHKFKKSNIDLNRKMLSQIAVLDTSTFKELILKS
jgi:large subunit ribosomal protein L20